MPRRVRILIVDDSRPTVMILERVLKKEGYEVFTAYDGEQGLQRAGELQPDLIVLDVMMPGLNGYEVCQRLRREPRTAGIGVLMLTAKGGIDDPKVKRGFSSALKERMAGFEAGAVEFLTKPVSAKELIRRVKTVLWSGTLGR